MESSQKPVTSYVLSLIGGAIILVTGIVGLAWFGAGGPEWGGLGGWMSGMMQGTHNFIGGGEFGLFSVISILGIVAGALVIIGAVMLRVRPLDHLTWGALILVFSVVSIADMGGYGIGAVLGIAGGALAVSYRPRTNAPPPPPQPAPTQ
jgi:hypothetical protein